MITELAGMDCTDEFDEIGHSNDANILLKEFFVGDLDTTTAITTEVPRLIEESCRESAGQELSQRKEE